MEKGVKNEAIEARISEMLSRGIGTFIDPGESFRKKLIAKAKGEYKGEIIIKFGVDPTRPDIHLGHAVVLSRLRQFQDLGCKVIFLIGDYTAQIGDPTGKSKVRPEIEQAEIEANMKTYLDQVGAILSLDGKVFSWIRNSDWFTAITDLALPEDYQVGMDVTLPNKEKHHIAIPPNSFVGKTIVFEKTRMQKAIGNQDVAVVTLRSLLWGLKHITLAQLIERDMFQNRIASGESLFMHEMLYPVFQGIDSDVLAQVYGTCDMEVGGTDQTFNMLMGRKIMEVNKKPPQAVLSFELLVGIDGKEKMSKSLDNYIAITDAPRDMFGKAMSIPDVAIIKYFELCTFTTLQQITEIKEALAGANINPRDIKMSLAQQIVEIYHGRAKGEQAKADFISTFQEKKLPSDMPVATVAKGSLLVEVLINEDIIDSKSEFRRLLGEGAIRQDGEKKLDDPQMTIEDDIVLRVGKHRFIKIIVE